MPTIDDTRPDWRWVLTIGAVSAAGFTVTLRAAMFGLLWLGGAL